TADRLRKAISLGRYSRRVHDGGCETMSESIAPDTFLRERSAGAGTALRILSVSSNFAIRRHGEKVLGLHAPTLQQCAALGPARPIFRRTRRADVGPCDRVGAQFRAEFCLSGAPLM